jgi:hypothetical protein
MSLPISPDCRDSNHTKCDEVAWDVDDDRPVYCRCSCHRPSIMSPDEVAAAMLYGPAPTGDEDPHVSQAVPDPGETSGPTRLTTQEQLEALPVGVEVVDVDHDYWVKATPSDWTHKEGPRLRSKSLAALWAPFTVVRVPEAVR